MTKEPAASILTAIGDHFPDPRKQIGAMYAQTAPSACFEVIYVDSTGRDDFVEALDDFRRRFPCGPRVRYQVMHDWTRAKAHNAAIAMAKGDLLVLLGDDFIAPGGFVEAHLALHAREPRAEVVGIGASLVGKLQRNDFYRWMEESGELFGVPFNPAMQSVPPDFFYAGNASVKRAFLERCGRFDESFPFDCWEDYELGLRMAQHGLHSVYVAGALVEHDHLFSLPERCRAMRRLGYSAAIHERKHPGGGEAWRKKLRRSALRWTIRAWRHRVRYAMTGDSADQRSYYRTLFDGNFSRGYRNAKAGQPPSSA